MPKEPSHVLKLTVRLDGADAAILISKADATGQTPTTVAHDLLQASLVREHQQAAEPISVPAATPISTEAGPASYGPRNARFMTCTVGLVLLFLGLDVAIQYRNFEATQKAIADLRAQGATKADLQAFKIETAKYVAPRLRDHQLDLDAIFRRLENLERVIVKDVLKREIPSKPSPDR
jgi:hypothetical protein